MKSGRRRDRRGPEHYSPVDQIRLPTLGSFFVWKDARGCDAMLAEYHMDGARPRPFIH